MIDHGDQRQEHRNHDAADDDGQKNNHDGFEQRSHRRHGVVHLFIVIVGNFEEHFRHGAGLFTDVHHADDHRWKNTGRLQRRGDGLAFLDAFMELADGVADDDVAGGFLHNGQRLQNGNAAAHERAEGAREAGDGDLADDGAERRHLELELVPHVTAQLRLVDDQQEQHHEHHHRAHRRQNIILDDVTYAEHQQRESRQRETHAAEHVLELGHDETHEQNHDAHGDDQNGHGIKQRGLDLALDLLRLFGKFREPLQHDFEHAAQFAGLDHVYEQLVENFRMLR